MSEKIYTDEEKIKRLTAWHESEKAEIAALRSQLATVTAERGELFNVAVKAFQAVEQMDLKGELSKYSAMQNLDYVCARISKKLWERVDAAALKGGKG